MNIHTFKYQKKFLQTLFCLFLKSSKAFSVSLNRKGYQMLDSNDCSTDNYMFKVNNRNNKTRCKICSKLTIKTPERRQWRLSGVFIVNFKHI